MNVLLDVLAVTDQQVTVLGHQLLRNLPILTYRSTPLGTHPLVPIRIDIQLPTQLMNYLLEMSGKRSDAASKNIHNWMLNIVLSDVFHTLIQCSNIIINRLSRSNAGNLHIEAIGIMILKSFGILGFACHVVLQIRIVLVVLSELIHERFIATVVTGNSL